ncbi:MAG TPA: TadE/TadG family type IV pilus assembly protein [Candidatus Limnocylindria bacterium]|nr:TadE/TadG family type IV pilus assembly protein [Candidatus Limnocylindria bacterium]
MKSVSSRVLCAKSVRHDAGQSLVELALALPLLLLILLGLADFGRAFYYTTIISNAARAGAAYLSQNPNVRTLPATDANSVKSKVCNETGLFAYNDPGNCSLRVERIVLGPPPTATDFPSYAPGQDAVISVTYDFRLISSYLIGRVVSTNPLPLRAQATYPGLK